MRWLALSVVGLAFASAAALAVTLVVRNNDSAGLTLGAFTPPDCDIPEPLPSDSSLNEHRFDGVTVGLPAEIDIATPSPIGGLPGGASKWSDGGRTFVITLLPSVSAFPIGPTWFERYVQERNPTVEPQRQARAARSLDEIAMYVVGDRAASCLREIKVPAGRVELVGSAVGDVSYEAFLELEDGRLLLINVDDGRSRRTIAERKLDFLAVLNSIRLTDAPAAGR